MGGVSAPCEKKLLDYLTQARSFKKTQAPKTKFNFTHHQPKPKRFRDVQLEKSSIAQLQLNRNSDISDIYTLF
jgi:hypothetical protein